MKKKCLSSCYKIIHQGKKTEYVHLGQYLVNNEFGFSDLEGTDVFPALRLLIGTKSCDAIACRTDVCQYIHSTQSFSFKYS